MSRLVEKRELRMIYLDVMKTMRLLLPGDENVEGAGLG
jgi:hypothetical protein